MKDGFEPLFSGMRISASGLSAERARMDVIAENIANARTTRTPGGGAYRRKQVVFEPLLRDLEAGGQAARGVGVARIVEDRQTPMQIVHDPSHPDRDEAGFVELPNVNTVMEMSDLITAMRAYEANLSIQENFVQMAERALELAR